MNTAVASAFTMYLELYLAPLAVALVLLGVVLVAWPSLRALLGRELFSMLVTPSLYVVMTLFVMICSLIFYLVPMQHEQAIFEPMVQIMKFLGIFFVPLLTMRLFAEERRSGTLELMMTAPVRPLAVVLGKYLAGYLLCGIMVLPSLVYVALLMWAGKLDAGMAAVELLGLAVLGAAYVGIGLFTSSLTRSQIAAAMSAMILILFCWLVGWFGSDDGTWLSTFWRGVSFRYHFDNSLALGVVDLADVFYFLSVAFISVLATWLVVTASADCGTSSVQLSRRRQLLVVAVLALALGLALFAIAAVDVLSVPVLALLDGQDVMPQGALPWCAVPAGMALCLVIAVVCLMRSGRGPLFGSLGFLYRRAPVALFLLSVLCVTANANIMLARMHWRQDFTDQALNTLDISTVRLLESLPQKVVISVFYTEQDRYEGYPVLARVKPLLTEYQTVSEQVVVKYLDPFRNPLAAREAGSALGVRPARLPSVAVVQYGNRKSFIPWDLVVAKKRDVTGREGKVFQGEMVFTAAIRRLVDPRVIKVYCTEGHGEYDAISMQPAPRRMGLFTRELRLRGYETERLSFSGLDRIPADCDLLLVASAFVPFDTEQLSVIGTYLDAGGRALFLVDPRDKDDPVDSLAPLLKQMNVKLFNDVLFDARNNAGGDATTILARGMKDHPVTAGRGTVGCYLTAARSLSMLARQKAWKARALLMSSRGARAYINEGDRLGLSQGQGPYVCAVTTENEQNGSRVVVIGDADLAGNFFFKKGHNRALLLSVVKWLARERHSIEIPERLDLDRGFDLSGIQLRIIWWIAVVTLPFCFALAGILVWWQRSQ